MAAELNFGQMQFESCYNLLSLQIYGFEIRREN